MGAAANAFSAARARARARSLLLLLLDGSVLKALCVYARFVCSLAFRGICVKAREGSQEKKEREKETDRPWGVASVG